MLNSISLCMVAVLLFYPENIISSTCNENVQCTFSHFAGCLRDISTNVLDVLTKPQPIVQCHIGPTDCSEIQRNGNTKSGIYRIWPLNWQTFGSFQVYCDMQTEGGGWTVFQRRGKYNQPEDYFYKDWYEYSVGFGKLNEDFWLGNERIFSLTNQGNYSLRIDMKDKEGNKRFALYREFWIDNEKQQYRLHLSDYSGDAGDSLLGHNNMKFSTKDKDNDLSKANCAQLYKGGWWYGNCHSSNLNGLYLNGPHDSYANGVNWKAWKGYNYSLSDVEMKIRRI